MQGTLDFAVILVSEVFSATGNYTMLSGSTTSLQTFLSKNLIAAERLLLRVLRSRGMNEKLARIGWF